MAVDATGDADLVAHGGWPFRKGGPVLMPGDPPTVDETAGRRQLPMSLYFTLVDNGAPVQPQLPPGCPRFRDDEDVPMITVIPHGHHVTVKMKVIGHDATDGASLSTAEQAGRRQMLGVVHYLQTRGFRGARYPSHRLAWVAPHIGIREGRRVEAVYSLRADDILAGRHFPDAVAVGSYHTDYHWPTVVQRAGTGITVQCPPHQIPLRAMRPRGAANLLVPGRCLGGDHLASSSFRVMGTCAQTGFAAGVAAALAVPARSVDAVDVPALRARLREAGARLDLAPYYSYLRRRRGYDEHAAQETAPVSDLAIAELPTGEVLVAYVAGGTLSVLRRYEERWQPAVAAGRLEAAAAEAGARLAFAVADAARSRTDGVEQVAAMASEVAETDAPPEVFVSAGDRRWMSADGGRTWRTGDGAVGGSAAAVAVPPAPEAAVVALTLVEDDHATLGVRRLFAAAWATRRGVVLGTSTGDGSWRQTMVAVPGGSGPFAMTASADGVLLACRDGAAVRCVPQSRRHRVVGRHARVAGRRAVHLRPHLRGQLRPDRRPDGGQPARDVRLRPDGHEYRQLLEPQLLQGPDGRGRRVQDGAPAGRADGQVSAVRGWLPEHPEEHAQSAGRVRVDQVLHLGRPENLRRPQYVELVRNAIERMYVLGEQPADVLPDLHRDITRLLRQRSL